MKIVHKYKLLAIDKFKILNYICYNNFITAK